MTVLVREVEASRSGINSSRHNSFNTTQDRLNASMDAESVITERLSTFRDISELQQKNLELLTVVRELSSTKELAENQLVEEKTAELKKELEVINSFLLILSIYLTGSTSTK